MSDFVLPETRYALSGDVNIAYQVMGDGPVDLVLVPGLISHVEFLHELPGYTAALRRLSRFARVVTFDKRGQGLSDRISGVPSLEQRMDDVRAVMDSIGSARAILIGFSEGAAMSVLFTATYPERVPRLVLVGAWVRASAPEGVWREVRERTVKAWGTGQVLKTVFKSQATNAEAVAQLAKLERFSSTPGALRTYLTLNRQVDVSSILPLLRIPTLVLHCSTDAQVDVAIGREIAKQIPSARYIEYPSGDHAFWTGDVESLLLDIEEFVTGRRDSASPDLERVLATVLFTDIVELDATGGADGRRDVAKAARSARPDRRTNGRKPSRKASQEHWRRRSGDVRWTRARSQVRVVVRCGCPATRFTAARRSPHWRDRSERPRYWRDNGSCGCPRHGAIRLERGAGITNCHRSCRGRGFKILRARIV